MGNKIIKKRITPRTKVQKAKDWFLNHSGYLQFLMNRLNADACGSDYPGYCFSSAEILTIYFKEHFGLNAKTVAGWVVRGFDGHYYTRIIDEEDNNRSYDVCATSSQFTGVIKLLWYPTEEGVKDMDGFRYLEEHGDDVLGTPEYNKNIAIQIFDHDWETYLNNVINIYAKKYM